MSLVKGGNALVVPVAETRTRSLLLDVRWASVATDVNVAAFAVGQDGRVLGEEYFVFFNNPTSPDQSIWLLEPTEGPSEPRAQVAVSLVDLPDGVEKVIVTIATLEEGGTLASLSGLTASVVSLQSGVDLETLEASERFTVEALVKVLELYRHASGWKVRSLLQGYANGLAGIATDLGVDVE